MAGSLMLRKEGRKEAKEVVGQRETEG